MEYALLFIYAIALWWLGTGLVVYLDGLPSNTFRHTMFYTCFIAVVAISGLVLMADNTTMIGAIISFTCGLMLWGWQELSYFLGYITGIRKKHCAEGCSGWRHFYHAIQVNLYHEISIIIGAALVLYLTWGDANQTGTWTYLLLWWMQLSAKLNVFLGVRNLSEEFLPEHMSYLSSFLVKKDMNFLFPFSITALTLLAYYLGVQAFTHEVGGFEMTFHTLLLAMVILASVEHWLLVLPLSPTALWDIWLSMRDRSNINTMKGSKVIDFQLKKHQQTKLADSVTEHVSRPLHGDV